MPFLPDHSAEPVRRWLRLGLLGLLGMAVIAMMMSLVLGTARYFRLPDGVVHARKAPKAKAPTPEAFFAALRDGAEPQGAAPPAAAQGRSGDLAKLPVAGGEAAPAADGAQRLVGEAQNMMKCSHEFNTSVGSSQADPDPAATEDFRGQLVKVADASVDRGAAWAGDAARFVCAVFDEKEAAELAKAGKLDQPLVSAVNFHIAQWDAAHQRVHDFEAQEKKRVEVEGAIAARHLAEAREGLSAALGAAGTSAATAVALLACLLLAAIESQLHAIRLGLDDPSLPDYGADAVPVVHEAVAAPMTPAPPPPPAAAPPLEMADPLEVEYQIPEEAISRG